MAESTNNGSILKGVDKTPLSQAQIEAERTAQEESNEVMKHIISIRKTLNDVTVGNANERRQTALEARELAQKQMSQIEAQNVAANTAKPKVSFWKRLLG